MSRQHYSPPASSSEDFSLRATNVNSREPILARPRASSATLTHRENSTDIPPVPPLDLRHQPSTVDSLRASEGLAKSRTRLGLHPSAPIFEEHDISHHSHMWWPKVRASLKEPFAEFWGVFVMVMFGDGAAAQAILGTGNTSAPGGDGYGNAQNISWGWGVGIMLGIYVAGDSGAYLNPGVLLTNCLLRQVPFRRFPIYFLAQFLGGLAAAAVIYGTYVQSINDYEGYGVRTVPPSATATGAIFCTYPQPFLSTVGQFMQEFTASALLMFVIFALKDDSNAGQFSASGAWFPLGLFFLVYGIGTSMGYQTGFSINLARDFGPRLMSYALGYSGAWSAGGYYFWVPMVAPAVGCVSGGILYDLFIYTGPSPINTRWFGLTELFKSKQPEQQAEKPATLRSRGSV